jgi:hypothetical protein
VQYLPSWWVRDRKRIQFEYTIETEMDQNRNGVDERGVRGEEAGQTMLSFRQSSELGSIGAFDRVEQVRQKGEGEESLLGHESGHAVAR